MITKAQMHVPYTYLTTEFSPDAALGKRILAGIADEMRYGRYTLGPAVHEFEEAFAQVCQTKHAIGVGNGTDALFLIMKAMGVEPGRVIATIPVTFLATVGAIIAADGLPQFEDIPWNQRDSRGILSMPVHWAGEPTTSNGQFIEDACQAIGAEVNGRRVGSLGIAAAFSLHPLKNVNVMGDGGVVTTNDDALAAEVRLLRNHGLQGRDTWIKPGYNSRLDTIQAVVGLEALKELDWVTERRIANAERYDDGLRGLAQVAYPARLRDIRHVYHLYQVQVENRDELLAYLQAHGVEAKVHYPTPLHLQPALASLGYKRGDFPNAERFCDTHISLPIHQYLTEEQIDYALSCIHDFYHN